MVENRAGGPEDAGGTTGAEGSQAGEGAAGGTGAAGATGGAKRGGRRAAAGAAGGAGGEGGTTRATRGRRGAGAATAGAGEEGGGGAAGTRKRGTRAAGGAATGRGGAATGRGGAATGRGGARGRKAAAQQGPDMRQDLRDFATAHQQGWSHQDWLNLVNALEQRGHDVSDRNQIGRDLERERLAMRLEQVQGMGERRVQALVDHFGTLWSLRQASVDEIAGVPNINRQLAEKIQEQVR